MPATCLRLFSYRAARHIPTLPPLRTTADGTPPVVGHQLATFHTLHANWQMLTAAAFPPTQPMQVHTFVLINREGKETLVKFHWKPTCGAHSLLGS